MEELRRLKTNIEKLMEAGYDDALVDSLIEGSYDLEGLNDSIEYELGD